MSYLLPHLTSGWSVDQAILTEEERVVVIRFGHDEDPTCMTMDACLASIADRIKNYAVIYVVDITEVPWYNQMYELYDPCTLMFFFRNKVSNTTRTVGSTISSTVHPTRPNPDSPRCPLCGCLYVCSTS